MRALVVVNPRATATTSRERDVLTHAVASEATVEIEHTLNRGHASALACRAMRDGVDLVIAMGGDGTINEVVNGLLTDGVHEKVPALGVVPSGSTNVFARALGLPNDAVEATGVLLDALRSDRRRRVSLGRLQADDDEDRWFVFAAGIGFDAAIIARVERLRQKGHESNEILYARAALREFLATDRRHPALRLSLPDGRGLDAVHYAIVANTDPWTFVRTRALHPTPEASFDSDLDIYTRTSMGLPATGLSFLRIARQNSRAGGWGAGVLHDVEDFRLDASRPTPVQVDGDLLGERRSIRFLSVRQALTVLV
ncbi:MAG: NAD(+)/NADH kinase [Actinobacteria bacterium]|nr:NAD(+)/NADH kinase [Actinomycetota bacterium]